MNKKILDKEVRDYLIEAGVDKKEVGGIMKGAFNFIKEMEV